MTIAGAHTVGAPDGGPGLPGTGWSPSMATFASRTSLVCMRCSCCRCSRSSSRAAAGTKPAAIRLVLALSASYAALFGMLLWQALRGQSVTNPDGVTLVAMASWAILTAGAVWMSASRSESRRVHAIVY